MLILRVRRRLVPPVQRRVLRRRGRRGRRDRRVPVVCRQVSRRSVMAPRTHADRLRLGRGYFETVSRKCMNP